MRTLKFHISCGPRSCMLCPYRSTSGGLRIHSDGTKYRYSFCTLFGKKGTLSKIEVAKSRNGHYLRCQECLDAEKDDKPRTVVITGCFQLFHEGHLNLLNRAKEYGKIIVLLNSDSGILELKDYLAEPYNVRKENLIKTGLIEQVISFNTDPTRKLREIRPDFIIAGDDHTKEEILSKGGKYAKEIIILPYTKGICSRDLYHQRNTLKE